MKQTIRINTFETNSSSEHCLIYCKKKELDAWKNGTLFVDFGDEKLITKKEAKEMYKKHKEWNPNTIWSFDEYCEQALISYWDIKHLLDEDYYCDIKEDGNKCSIELYNSQYRRESKYEQEQKQDEIETFLEELKNTKTTKLELTKKEFDFIIKAIEYYLENCNE